MFRFLLLLLRKSDDIANLTEWNIHFFYPLLMPQNLDFETVSVLIKL